MRRAFTLIEVLLALVITGLVVTLAYGTAQAGFDTQARLAEYRVVGESDAVVRSLLSDALRHAVDGVRGGEAVFVGGLAGGIDLDRQGAGAFEAGGRGETRSEQE